MRRYLLFMYRDYYPSGGVHDFKGSSESIDDLKDMARQIYDESAYQNYLWFVQIVDRETMACLVHAEVKRNKWAWGDGPPDEMYPDCKIRK